MFGITSYKLLVVKINGNVGVRVSDRPNSPIVVGRDGTNGSTISDASSDRLFDKKRSAIFFTHRFPKTSFFNPHSSSNSNSALHRDRASAAAASRP
jgi:hypothetical protein